MLRFFDPEALRNLAASRRQGPGGFHYGFVSGLFREEVYQDLIAGFPPVEDFSLVDKLSGGGRKRFYVGPGYISGKHWGCICEVWDASPLWKEVLLESASEEFMSGLASATGVRFNSLCNFGFTFGNAGCVQEPHLDGAIRPGDLGPIHATIACLLYLNAEAGGASGTQLYTPDRKTVLYSVPDLRNSLFFFEQHPLSWHGFPPVPQGADRRLISLSYSQETPPIVPKTSTLHRAFCPLRAQRNMKRLVRPYRSLLGATR